MSDEPETEETPVSAQAGMQTAVEVGDIDEEIQKTVEPEAGGKHFFFGDINVFKFSDGTTYHVQKQHAYVTNPKLIKNLVEHSQNPIHKIFPKD